MLKFCPGLYYAVTSHQIYLISDLSRGHQNTLPYKVKIQFLCQLPLFKINSFLLNLFNCAALILISNISPIL